MINARDASVEMLAADEEEMNTKRSSSSSSGRGGEIAAATAAAATGGSQVMPHTWVEVALNPKKVQSPNWWESVHSPRALLKPSPSLVFFI